MTKREYERRARQAQTLRDLGFTAEEGETLRRASMTLQRWHEAECGTDRACLVRGRFVAGEFQYDDDGAPYWEYAGLSGRARYTRTVDRERGAKRRIAHALAARHVRSGGTITAYIQTDPRGAALYLIRPGDVPEGGDVRSYYNRGVCVY